jgi:cytochrome bd-type quinol oxidase subunit 2
LRYAATSFLFGCAGLAISIWPYIVPYQVTIWAGAADPQSRSFVGIGAIIIIPIFLAYQFRAYWVFRGNIREEHTPDDEGPALESRRISSQTPGLQLS